jgi:hypothetical protein
LLSGATRLAAVLAWVGFAIPGAAQGPERKTAPTRPDTSRVDACTVAPVDQLRFLVTAGLTRAFPIGETQGDTTVLIAEPRVLGARCPNLRVDLALTLRRESGPKPTAVATAGAGRLALTLTATAVFTTKSGQPPRGAAALDEAALCVRRVEVVDLGWKSGPPWVTPTWLAGRLGSDRAGHTCFDVTSLVYVFLQRGGTLARSP